MEILPHWVFFDVFFSLSAPSDEGRMVEGRRGEGGGRASEGMRKSGKRKIEREVKGKGKGSAEGRVQETCLTY